MSSLSQGLKNFFRWWMTIRLPNDKNAVELTMMSDIVIAYEREHYPIEKPTVAELIELSLEEKGMTQRQLASEIGVSPSRVNDYVAGRSEPTLKIARSLCRVLGIQPAAHAWIMIAYLLCNIKRDSTRFRAFFLPISSQFLRSEIRISLKISFSFSL